MLVKDESVRGSGQAVEVAAGVWWDEAGRAATCGACGNVGRGLESLEAAASWGDGHLDICFPAGARLR